MPERFREHGHRHAHLDPLAPAPALPADWPADEQRRRIWCSTIGAEISQVESTEQRSWLVERFERAQLAALPAPARRALHDRLVAAEALEAFLHAKHVAAKRFSIEGAESLLPLLDAALGQLAADGAREVIVGLAHRGRLNLMVNLLGMPRGELLALIRGEHDDGDVPYHRGYSGQVGALAVTFAPNPSHLEAVDPVVLGRVRARQEVLGVRAAVPLLIHGDASFTGQGIVAETLNLARLDGYRTGGTIHVVVDNQLGFTTPARHGRSTSRATDLARAFGIPILHVNGDDPEAAARVGQLAAAWRQHHATDIVIDLVCFRRRGHNEADEPRFTQPLLYAAIDAHPSVRAIHARTLAADGVLTEAASAEALARDIAAWRAVAPTSPAIAGAPGGTGTAPHARTPTAVTAAQLADLASRLARLPDGFHAHPKVAALLDERARRTAAGEPLDWSTAEMLAFATLLADGVDIRLSGQDTRRGTFSQRHAVIVDPQTGAEHTPLASLGTAGRFAAWDSPLSEAAVLGFEYGFAAGAPGALVVWEAQYGDFINGAQVIVDEFLAAGAEKWREHTSLVLLLPHGYEGQGPDHSYARVDRFLALAAGDNLRICQPTSAAQLFHLLREQATARCPLVVFTPKSALRAAAWRSPPDELAAGRFRPVLPDPRAASRVLLCSGRIHDHLVEARARRGRDDVAIVRLEQLHPLDSAISSALATYDRTTPVVWVQDEPRNLGAWPALVDRLPPLLAGRELRCVARAASGSPAPGSLARHRREQAALVDAAFERA